VGLVTIALSTVLKYNLKLGGLITFNSWESESALDQEKQLSHLNSPTQKSAKAGSGQRPKFVSYNLTEMGLYTPGEAQPNMKNTTPVLFLYTCYDPLINNIISEASIVILKRQFEIIDIIKFQNIPTISIFKNYETIYFKNTKSRVILDFLFLNLLN